MKKNSPICLFFISGAVPKPGEIEAANSIRGRYDVRFRNASAVNSNEAVEHCAAVAGAVPLSYGNFPAAGMENTKKAQKSSGESPAAVVKPPEQSPTNSFKGWKPN